MSIFYFIKFVYILFFAAILIIRLIYSLIEVGSPFPSFKNKKKFKEKILEWNPLIIFSFLIFISLKHILRNESFFPQSIDLFFQFNLIIKIFGAIIGLIGLFLLARGYYSLGHFWKIGIDQKFKAELITSGIFKYTRNPIYSFFNLFALSFFCLSGRLIYLIIFIILVINFHWEILREEKFLRGVFGEKYEEYFRKTPRYL